MAFGVGLASVVLASGSNVAQAYPATEKVNEVFDGTPLEGARIQGKLLQIAINRYGPQIIDFVRTSQSSYARSIEHFNNVFDEQIAGSLPVGSKVVLFETDKHFNFGMDSVFAAIAKKYNAHVLLSGGDETFSGSSFEEQGIANLSANLKDVQIVMAPGNHDSIETERQAKRHGITVLDGKVITVEGLRILGDNDPRRSVFGKEIEEVSQETIEELGLRLAGVACQAGGVDIVLAHEPRVADAVINSGCTSIAMSGHLHKHYEFPRRSASGQLNYNGASAGGAMNGQSTLGPLRDVAEVTAFIFDSATNQLTSFDVIRINPDTSATIDRYVPSAIGAPKKVE
jgi:predicted phosphodiesterase